MIRAVMIAAVVLMLSAGSAAAVMLRPGPPAPAGTVTGSRLLHDCHEYEKREAGQSYDRLPLGTCMGYITGVIWASPDDGCPPAGTNFGEMTLIVISYLKRNSAQLHRAAGYLVEEALREAWPCPK
jgi:hypothetical protein